MIEVVVSGALSGMSGWFASFPLDVIKTNIQGSFGITDPHTKKLQPKQKMWPTAKRILRTKGLIGLYSVRPMKSCIHSIRNSLIHSFIILKFIHSLIH
jgi:hypothetical protein